MTTLIESYPKDWTKIAARIRERAGNRCERCGVAPGEPYTRFSGRVVSETEFERLGKVATEKRRQRNTERRDAITRARKRFLSPVISESQMAGDYENGYFAEGGFYPIEKDSASLMIETSNNNRALHFEVDHIDGDKSNNDDSNLQFLCKRCHMDKHRNDPE